MRTRPSAGLGRIARHLLVFAAGLAAIFAVADARGAAQSGERISFDPPSGWALGSQSQQNGVQVTTFLPPGQTDVAWQQKITLQVMQGTKLRKAEDYIAQVRLVYQQACEQVGTTPVDIGRDNGYLVAVTVIGCTKGKRYGLGGFAMLKVVQGRAGLYVIQRLWRGPAYGANETPIGAEEMQDWARSLSGARLCDLQDPQRKCPVTAAAIN